MKVRLRKIVERIRVKKEKNEGKKIIGRIKIKMK